MAREPEVRMKSSQVIIGLAVIALAVIGFQAGWFEGFGGGAAAPAATDTSDTTPATLQIVPAIEKTKIYVSAIDAADFEGENQKNRVAGTADLIKSGNVLETVSTVTSSGVASTAEFNGGDTVTVLANATSYYSNAVTNVKITETLQPFEVMIKAAGSPDIYVEDENGDTLSTPYNISLATNDVSKTHKIVVERPGDDTWYRLCGVAADFDDDYVEPLLNVDGSFTEGDNLGDDYDYLDSLGADKVWEYKSEIKNFDSVEIPFVVKTAKDVNPSEVPVLLYVFDCEMNLQNGVIVDSNEDSADADVGETNTLLNITIG